MTTLICTEFDVNYVQKWNRGVGGVIIIIMQRLTRHVSVIRMTNRRRRSVYTDTRDQRWIRGSALPRRQPIIVHDIPDFFGICVGIGVRNKYKPINSTK